MKNQAYQTVVNWPSIAKAGFVNRMPRILARTGSDDRRQLDFQRVSALKERVVDTLASEFDGWLDAETVRRVVSEADALAALTPFPALFLSALAEEKVRAASHWQARQRIIAERALQIAA